MSSLHAGRVLQFEGAKNVRDLGGLAAGNSRTRFGVIFRADGLSRLTDPDLEQLAALGLTSIIDLRYDEERARAPDKVPGDCAPTFFHRGFLPDGSVELFTAINDLGADADTARKLMTRNYSRIPFEHSEELSDVMHYLLHPDNAPHMIHCTSGKDRTGLVVAYILLAIGVSLEDVMFDYQMSNGEAQTVDIFGPAARAEAVEVIMQARPEYIQAALGAIDTRCGGIQAYLKSYLRFGPAECLALTKLLLE